MGHKIAFTQGECVCVCAIAYIASSRRVHQLMGGVNWPNSRVHIWQTSKKVFVLRCGLTSDREAAPRPPAPAHPRQNQYMWTLKMHAPGIRLQERSRPCAAQDARSFGLMCAFFAALLPRAAPENRTRSHKSRKNFDVLRSPLPQGECAAFNARHGCMESMAIKQHSF